MEDIIKVVDHFCYLSLLNIGLVIDIVKIFLVELKRRFGWWSFCLFELMRKLSWWSFCLVELIRRCQDIQKTKHKTIVFYIFYRKCSQIIYSKFTRYMTNTL